MRPSLRRSIVCTLVLAASAIAGCRGTIHAPSPDVPVATPADVAPVASVAPAPVAPERGEVRDASFWSPSLGVGKRYRVWLPPGYARDPQSRYPLAVYLHGLYGSEGDWTRQGAIGATLDSLVAAGMPPMIVVMPDGDDSWYVTWNVLYDAAGCRRAERKEPAAEYCVAWGRYDEYVARDLVAHVDTTWRTRADRAHRAIAGLSMGGYGAVTIALRYPEVFAAAASHSGVLSPLYDGPAPFAPPPRYAASTERLRERWRTFWFSMGPAFGKDTTAWWARDPARLARVAREAGATLPALWFDAGRDDALVIDQNRAFDWELTRLEIPHEWHERPGRHDWRYWRANAAQSLQWIAGRIARQSR